MERLTLLILVVLLVAATVTDFKHRKIPNWITFPGFFLGIFLTAAYTNGTVTSSLVHSLLGATVALVLWLPVHVLGKFGARDVMLLAMAGTFLGPVGILWASLWTLIAGGLLAVGVLVAEHGARNIFYRAVGSIAVQPGSGATDGATAAAGENTVIKTSMPYAAAIAAGSLIAYLQS